MLALTAPRGRGRRAAILRQIRTGEHVAETLRGSAPVALNAVASPAADRLRLAGG